MILRIISFCIEKIDYINEINKRRGINLSINDKWKSTYNFIDLMLYTYYPTFQFIAPFINFNQFHLSFVSKNFN